LIKGGREKREGIEVCRRLHRVKRQDEMRKEKRNRRREEKEVGGKRVRAAEYYFRFARNQCTDIVRGSLGDV
jgi:hypothetical protein